MEDNSICKNILGCPEPGFYGSDCSMPCPDLHCRYCHLETGACQGCEPGYHGHNCDLSNFFCFENTKYSYTKTCFNKDETFKLIHTFMRFTMHIIYYNSSASMYCQILYDICMIYYLNRMLWRTPRSWM